MALSTSRIYSSVNENFVLFKACEQGDLETLERYLNNLSSTDLSSIRDDQKATLVHHAARHGHLHILEYLIEKKHLDINQLRTEHGATCAHDAAVCDQVEVLNYVFHYHQLNNHYKQDSNQKLRWNVRDEQGNCPLHLAAAYGSIRSLHYLLEHELADPHIRSYNGFQPIHYAASSGHNDCLKLLLNVAPDTVNEQTNTLLTPVYLASQYGSIETIKILISHGANFKLKDQNGLNCLHAACQSSHLHVVQWLVERQNANINDVDYNNNTSLHYAAATGNEPILIYLLDKNARILKSNSGNSPLHVAAENGHQGACAILIERGHCSVSIRNNDQLTAIDLANLNGFSSLGNELRLRIDSPSSSLSSPSNKNSSTISKVQLENATIVRLIVKKRNVERCDASSQVNENDFQKNLEYFPSKMLTNNRFDFSELRHRVEKHEAIRRDTTANADQFSNVLMHSMDSINQKTNQHQRPKLPVQTYGPWLKNGNLTPQQFHQAIQTVGSNLRKVRRDSLIKKDNRNSNSSQRRSRQSQSVGPTMKSSSIDQQNDSSISNDQYLNNKEDNQWKRTGYQTRPEAIPISKSHQFITSPNLSSSRPLEKPQWQRDLIDRRRAAANGTNS